VLQVHGNSGDPRSAHEMLNESGTCKPQAAHFRLHEGCARALGTLLRESSHALLLLEVGLPYGRGFTLLERLPSIAIRPIPAVIPDVEHQ
jgi:hypothetical protein